MFNANKTIVSIPNTVLDEIKDHFLRIQKAIAPYATPLTAAERQTMPKMSDKTESFVIKISEYVKTNPEFVPSYLNASDFLVDVDNVTGITPISKIAEQIQFTLNDMAMVAGSEAYIGSLTYYNAVKQADKNGVGNARSIHDDLQKRFTTRKKQTSAA